MITRAELLELLSYSPATGVLRWLRTTKGHRAGAVAGWVQKGPNGYRRIKVTILGIQYSAHRLIWLMVTGDWPEAGVDHEDGNGTNNRWGNLRPATQAQNCQNTKLSRRNTSGFRGVFNRGPAFELPWRAQICTGGQRIDLGSFATAEAASSAYLAARARLHDLQPVPRELLRA